MLQHFIAPLLGGITLGVLAAGRLVIRGEILGVSGFIRSLLNFRGMDVSKAIHLAGMAAGGFLLPTFAPASLETIPGSYSVCSFCAVHLQPLALVSYKYVFVLTLELIDYLT